MRERSSFGITGTDDVDKSAAGSNTEFTLDFFIVCFLTANIAVNVPTVQPDRTTIDPLGDVSGMKPTAEDPTVL